MTLVRRIPKGSPLTAAEHDGNIDHFENDIIQLQAASNLLSENVSCISVGGLSYAVTADRYPINGVNYSATPLTVTLVAADATNPRMDFIYADINGNISKRTGTPGASAAPEDYDPLTEFVIRYILVKAGATTGIDFITGEEISTTNVWVDAAVPTWSFNSLSTKITEDTTAPLYGTTSIKGLVTEPTDVFELNNTKTRSVSEYTNLIFEQKSTVTFWRIYFYNAGSLVGLKTVPVATYGVADAVTADLYTMIIPMSIFGFTDTNFNKITIAASDSAATWQIDNIRFGVGDSISPFVLGANTVGVTELKRELKGVVDLGDVSGTLTIDFSQDIIYKFNMTADTTLAFTTGSLVAGKSIELIYTGNFILTHL